MVTGKVTIWHEYRTWIDRKRVSVNEHLYQILVTTMNLLDKTLTVFWTINEVLHGRMS